MSYVTEYTVENDAWTKVSDGLKNVGIQFNGQGNIRIHVGDADPATLDAPGILLASSTEGVPSTFGLGALPAGANVYARAFGEYDEVKLTVLAY